MFKKCFLFLFFIRFAPISQLSNNGVHQTRTALNFTETFSTTFYFSSFPRVTLNINSFFSHGVTQTLWRLNPVIPTQ